MNKLKFQQVKKWMEEAEQHLNEWELRQQLAERIVGLPYYWGDFNGVLEKSQRQGKVIAHVVNQRTGEECFWMYDSLTAFKHLEDISPYASWHEYDQAQKELFIKDYQELLRTNNYPEKDIALIIEKCRSLFQTPLTA